MQRLVALLFVLACACGGGGGGGGSKATGDTAPSNASASTPAAAGDGAPTDAEIQALLDDVIAMFERLSALADQPCGDVATAMNAEADGNRTLVERADRITGEAEERANRIFEERGYGERLDAASVGFVRTIERCEGDAAFEAAIDRLGKLMGGASKAP